MNRAVALKAMVNQCDASTASNRPSGSDRTSPVPAGVVVFSPSNNKAARIRPASTQAQRGSNGFAPTAWKAGTKAVR